MNKLPSVIAIAAITALLAGCASTPADEPAAGSAPASPTASASADATPTATPSPVATATPSNEPVPTQEDAAPVETPPVGIETPVEPPAPEPTVEAPVEAPVVVATAPTWDSAPRITLGHGSSVIVTGTGYQPGQNVFMFMGIYQTDSTEVDEQSAIADATGSVSFTITITPDIAPSTYGVVTMVRDGLEPADMEATKRFALIDVIAA